MNRAPMGPEGENGKKPQILLAYLIEGIGIGSKLLSDIDSYFLYDASLVVASLAAPTLSYYRSRLSPPLWDA